jgi:hypothetical protein
MAAPTYGRNSFYRPTPVANPYAGGRNVIPYLSQGQGVRVENGRPVPGQPQTRQQPTSPGQQPPAPPTVQQPNKPPVLQTPNPYDYSGDPVLQNVLAGNDAFLSDQKAHALQEQKRVLLGLGSRQLGRKLLGDDPFVDSISDDPDRSFSALAQIAFSNRRNKESFDESENQQNLFYSGHRAQGLQDLLRERLLQESQAVSGAEGALGQIMQQLLGSQRQAQAARLAAEEAAYMRALVRAQNGFSAAAASGGSNESGGGGGGSVAVPGVTAANFRPLSRFITGQRHIAV